MDTFYSKNLYDKTRWFDYILVGYLSQTGFFIPNPSLTTTDPKETGRRREPGFGRTVEDEIDSNSEWRGNLVFDDLLYLTLDIRRF